MIWSSLVKSACVAIALSGFSAPQAGAIEIQGSNPSATLNDAMISKAYMAHRGVTARGPNGGVYHRGGTVGGYRGGAYRGGAYRGGGVYRGAGVYRGGYGGWARPSWYHWRPAARSRPALRSAYWPPARPSLTRASRQRRACAGTTPTRAIGRDFGTPASELRAISGPAEVLALGLAARLR